MASRAALVYRLNLSKKSDHKNKIKPGIHKRNKFFDCPNISNICDVFLSDEVDFELYIVICPDCNQLHYGNVEFKTKPPTRDASQVSCSVHSYRNYCEIDDEQLYVTNDLIACASNDQQCHEIRLFETLHPAKDSYLIDSNHPIFLNAAYNLGHMAVLYELNMLSEYAVVSNLSIHLIPDLFIIDILDTESLVEFGDLIESPNPERDARDETNYIYFTLNDMHNPWSSTLQQCATPCNNYTTAVVPYVDDVDYIRRDKLLLYSYKRNGSDKIEYGGIKDNVISSQIIHPDDFYCEYK